jgi:Domain of unknown function (DUF4375)
MKAGWTVALALLVISGCGNDEQQTASPPCAAPPPLPAVVPRETSRRVSVDNAYAVHEGLLGKVQPDENLSALNPGERAVFAVLFLEAEVNNGGHFQFFFNTGQLTDEALAGLQRLDAKEYEQLLQRVVAQFPGCDVPDDLDDVQAEIDKMSPEQEALVESADDRFFELDEEKTLGEYAAEYISAHPDEF